MSSSFSLPGASGWTAPRIERLVRLWSEGQSASQVAESLGVSRNAVIGKVHRMGLSKDGRHAEARPTRVRPKTSPRAPRIEPPTRIRRVLAPEPLAGLVGRLEDLPRRSCHWPIGDPKAADFAFCGRRADAGPYCAMHHGLAAGPGRPRR